MLTRKTGRLTAAVLTLCATIATALTPAGSEAAALSSPRAGDFSVIGHRGYPNREHTENTMPSFNAARRAGATAIETDLHLTADLVPVVMHDADLDRTTDCTGLVRDTTADLVETTCHGTVAGEPVPTAQQVLAWGKAHEMNEILEIKQDDRDLWDAAALTRLDQMIRDAGMLDRVVVMSFSASVLRRAEEVDPALRTQWIAGSWPDAWTTGTEFDGVNLYAGDLTAGRVRRLHELGMRVLGRKTNRRSDWAHLVNVGADGLLTDRTATYLDWQAHPARTHHRKAHHRRVHHRH